MFRYYFLCIMANVRGKPSLLWTSSTSGMGCLFGPDTVIDEL